LELKRNLLRLEGGGEMDEAGWGGWGRLEGLKGRLDGEVG
jgi:hypothetical protein